MKDSVKNDENSSPKAKGLRLKEARKMTYLGIAAFAQKHGLNYGTLKSWEFGLHGGLPPKRISEIIQALKLDGINCTSDWILYGMGPKPYAINTQILKKTITLAADSRENHQIQKELQEFCEYYGDVASMTVDDDGLAPIYKLGDIVAGVKKYGSDIKKTVNQDCILQVEDQEKPLLRTVCLGATKDRFTLVCRNQETNTTQPVLYDIKLISAAPVIWIRRSSDYLIKPFKKSK